MPVKLLESFRIAAAASARKRLGRLGIVEKPGRLELALDDFDAPSQLGASVLGYEAWQDRVVGFIQWAGPAPVRITAHPDNPLLADMVRFCHRLEMPTRVRTSAQGLDRHKAEELIDRGMMLCELVAATVAEAEPAVRHLIHGRLSRAATLRVVLHATKPVSPADRDSARGLGIDEVIEVPDWRNANGQPGISRTSGHCPIASVRLLLSADDSVVACPFHPGGGMGMLPDSAANLAGHRAAIRSCTRVCSHPTLT